MKLVQVFGEVVLVLMALLLFFTALELIGDAFGLMASGFAERILTTTSDPFVGLAIGIIATAIFQSSTMVTSIIVALVAAGGLTLGGAIPMVMGANIGSSLTSTIVSLGFVTRRDEFKRAMSAATVHDFFNLLTVAVLFPLELTTRILTRISRVLADGFSDIGGADLLSPISYLTDPVKGALIALLRENGVAVLMLGVVFLFVALYLLTTMLKRLILGRAEKVLHTYVFGSAPVALLVGIVITGLVQSSSITTSLMVPLVAAGIVTVTQIFPFVLGANIGTTLTAILAAMAMASGSAPGAMAALQIGFVHLSFNVIGMLIFLPLRPLRRIPIRLAEGLGNLIGRNRLYALVYVIIVFVVIPLGVILATRGLDLAG